jgi:hemoglobin/transferrin/lactoferrin receptor protein
MRNILLAHVAVLLGVFDFSFAQGKTMRLLDNETLQGVPFVKVANEKKEVFTSNEKGIISSVSGTFFTIRHVEYKTITLSYDELIKLNFKVYLQSNANTMEEVVLSASRFEEKKKDVAQKIQVIRSKDLQQMNQSSTADVLANSGNVFVQKSQLGGGSPIIRGFETNKVLLVIDGIRMNNAIYRGGHLQNVITLDNSIMDRVEVLYGPGSVVYGSDAIGGVMSFTTKNPTFSSSDKILVKGGAYSRYFSAASGYAANANVSIGSKKVASLTSITFSKFNDLRQGARRSPFVGNFGARTWYVERINGIDSMMMNADTNLQVGSGYSQYDILQKFIIKQGDGIKHILNLQLSNSSNIDRYDRLTQLSGGKPKFAEWYYGPQFRLLSAYTFEHKAKTRFYDLARVTLGIQNIEESRMDRRFNKAILNHRIEKLNIITLNSDFFKKIGQHEVRYGADGFFNGVNSTAFQRDIVADTTAKLDTRYPDGGSFMQSFALFGTHTWEINDKFIVNDGIRLNYVGLNAKFNDKTFFPFPFNDIKQNYQAVNGNIGLIVMPTSELRMTFNASTGFRAPNVDDLTKVFESVPGKVLVPNPNLKAEFSYTGDFGISYQLTKGITASANTYFTYLTNALTVAKGNFDGQDSVIYDGELSEVMTTTNAGKAFVTGFEGALFGQFNENFGISATVNYTYGRIILSETNVSGKDSLTPLDHIPPIFGKFSLTYNKGKFRSEFFMNYSGWKLLKDYNLNGEDNYTFALPEGMPSWYTLNARLGYVFSNNLTLQLACENLLDQNYRNFASNISAPGRNFIVTLRGNF